MSSDPHVPQPDLPRSLQRLALEVEGWIELGAAEHALVKLQPLLEVPAARPVARMLQTRALIELERYRDALRRMDEIAEYPHDPEWLAVTRGWCHKRLGDLHAAAAAMINLLSNRPRSAIGHYNLGCYLTLLGETERALNEVTIACGLDDGFREHARGESDLDALRDDPRFAALLGAPDDS